MFNIYNVRCPAPATSSDLTAIAGIFETWERGAGRAQRSNQMTAVRVGLTALDGPGAPFLLYQYPAPTILGAVASTIQSVQVTACVSLRTGLSGRSFRGRIYWPGVAGSQVTANFQLTPAFISGLQSAVNTLRAALLAGGYELCVLSLYSGIDSAGHKIPRAAGILTPVTQVVVGNRLDTQRRRLPAETRT